MIVKVQLPNLGEGIDSADVVSVLVEVGQSVSAEQAVIEVETEKATLEVPSDAAGTISEVLVQVGDTVQVGQEILAVEVDGDTAEAPSPADDAAQAEAEDESEPATPTTSPEQPDDTADPTPETSDSDSETDSQPVASTSSQASSASEAVDPVPAAPSVRRLARELGVPIRQVTGSGDRGRIHESDVSAFVREQMSGSGHSSSSAEQSPPAPTLELPDFTRWGEVQREPLSKIRRVTVASMARAWSQIPHVTQHDSADITDLEAARQRFADAVAERGGKLTVTAILVKAVAQALREFPTFNASLDLSTDEVILKHSVHIGVAVDTDNGLLVPVVRDADRKTVAGVAVELADLASRARDRTVKPDEMQGATFTITNLGGIGGTQFTPIVNWPEVAILGVSRSEIRPQWIDETWQPRTILPLSLSYDHRLIDGAEAARFLRWLADSLSDPFRIVLGV